MFHSTLGLKISTGFGSVLELNNVKHCRDVNLSLFGGISFLFFGVFCFLFGFFLFGFFTFRFFKNDCAFFEKSPKKSLYFVYRHHNYRLFEALDFSKSFVKQSVRS